MATEAPKGTLKVTVNSALNLRAKKKKSKATDQQQPTEVEFKTYPVVTLKRTGEKQEGTPIAGTDPKWNQSFEFKATLDKDDVIGVDIFEKTPGGSSDNMLGSFVAKGVNYESDEGWYDLKPTSGSLAKADNKSKVHISIEYKSVSAEASLTDTKDAIVDGAKRAMEEAKAKSKSVVEEGKGVATKAKGDVKDAVEKATGEVSGAVDEVKGAVEKAKEQKDFFDRNLGKLSGPRHQCLRSEWYYENCKGAYRFMSEVPVIGLFAPVVETVAETALSITPFAKSEPEEGGEVLKSVEKLDKRFTGALNGLDNALDNGKDSCIDGVLSVKDNIKGFNPDDKPVHEAVLDVAWEVPGKAAGAVTGAAGAVGHAAWETPGVAVGAAGTAVGAVTSAAGSALETALGIPGKAVGAVGGVIGGVWSSLTGGGGKEADKSAEEKDKTTAEKEKEKTPEETAAAPSEGEKKSATAISPPVEAQV